MLKKQPKRDRLWLNDGSILRLTPEFAKYVWSYDFMQERTYDDKVFRILSLIDEHSRECLLAKVARNFTLHDVLDCLPDLLYDRG